MVDSPDFDYNDEASKNAAFYEQVKPLLEVTLRHASLFDTKEKVLKRTLEDIEKCLGIFDRRFFEEQGTKIAVHTNNVRLIDNLYAYCVSKSDIKIDTLAQSYIEFRHSPDYVEPGVLKNLVRDFIKVDEIPTGSKKERVLKTPQLNMILAVDGLAGVYASDVYAYINNLKYGIVDPHIDPHVETVRCAYSKCIPSEVTGTDAAHFLRHSLLELYRPYATDIEVADMVDRAIADSLNHLTNDSRPELQDMVKFKAKFVEFYRSMVPSLPDVAREKLNFFVKGFKTSRHLLAKKKKVTQRKKYENQPSSEMRLRDAIKLDDKKKRKTRRKKNKKGRVSV